VGVLTRRPVCRRLYLSQARFGSRSEFAAAGYAGAILGGLFRGAKGAAVGTTVGAGAGSGVSAAGKGEQIVLLSETALNFQLQSPLSVMPTTQLLHGAQGRHKAQQAQLARPTSENFQHGRQRASGAEAACSIATSWERKRANPAPKVWGWEPQISLKDGLACTYEWIEEQVREIA
jgi:hypothetical protein